MIEADLESKICIYDERDCIFTNCDKAKPSMTNKNGILKKRSKKKKILEFFYFSRLAYAEMCEDEERSLPPTSQR